MAPDETILTEDRLFGNILLQLKLATPERIKECLDLQKLAKGKRPRLGDLMIQMGYLTFEDVERALKAKSESVEVRCPKCGADYRLLGPDVNREYLCKRPGCGGTLVLPAKSGTTISATPKLSLRSMAQAPEEVRSAATDIKRLFGKYVLLKEIGRGGMGAVFKAWDSMLSRHVAVKFLTGVGDKEDVERFFREAQTAAGLNHANIAQVFEVGEHDGKYFLSMQYVDGHNLAGRKLPTKRAVELIKTVAQALETAHVQGIIHRDLKPANIMLDSKGKPYVMDFGLAKSLRAQSRLTQSGAVMGTPAYMAPEQARGEMRRMGRRSDVYSLGATLYELLTGRPPFHGPTPLETLMLVNEKDPTRPSLLARDVPPDAETICLKAMEKDPLRRYASAKALAEDCERFLRGDPIQAKPVGTVTRVWRKAKRQRALWLGVAAGLFLLVPVGIWLAYRAHQSGQRYEQNLAAAQDLLGKGDLDNALTAVVAALELRDTDEARTLRDKIQSRVDTRNREAREAEEARRRREALLRQAKEPFDRGFGKLDESMRDLYRPGANLEQMRSRAREAISFFDEALRLHPDYEEAHLHRGRAKLLLNDLDGALADFTAAIERRPNYTSARLERGKVHLRRHRREIDRSGTRWEPVELWPGKEHLDAALADFREAARGGEGLELEMGRAYQALAEQNFRSCLGTLDRLIAGGDAKEEVYCLRGDARYWTAWLELRDQGEEQLRWIGQAADDYQQAIDRRANYLEALIMLGASLSELGRPDEMLAVFERGLALDPDQPMIHVALGNIENNKGQAERAQGRAEAATRFFENALERYAEALALDPDYVPALSNRAAVLGSLRRTDDSLRDLEQALQVNPNHTQSLANLAANRCTQRRFQDALDLISRAIRMRDSVGFFYYVRAQANEGLGRRDAVRADLELALRKGVPPPVQADIEEWLSRLQ